MASPNAILIDERDSVVTAVTEIPKGSSIIAKGCNTGGLKTQELIPKGFKVALSFIPRESFVYKYGKPIGVAKRDIKAGTMVHVHNIRSNRGKEYGEGRR